MANDKTKTNQPNTTVKTWTVDDMCDKQPSWKKWVKFLTPVLILLAGLIVAAKMLIATESEMLYKAQELSLWIPGDTFYKMFSIYPGGWLAWIGSYMTDFFYNPSTGVWMMMAAWAVIMALLTCLFRLRGKTVFLTALIPILLLACLTQTGYWIFYQKLHGHLWVPTLAVLINTAAALLFRGIEGRFTNMSSQEKAISTMAYVRTFASIIYLIGFCWFGYQAMGMWSFLGIALMVTPISKDAFASKPQTARTLALLAIGISMVTIVPRMAYYFVYEQTMIDEIYVAGMPCFQYGQANVAIYRWPYYLLALSFVPMMLVGWIPEDVLSKKKGLRNLLSFCTITALLAGGIYVVKERWNHDKNLHAEVAMENAIDRLDWEGVLTTMRECGRDTIAPTRAMVMMKNLALFRLGRAGDEMFLYPEGSRQQNMDEWYKYGDKMYKYPATLDTITDPAELKKQKTMCQWGIKLSQIAGKLLYYNYGKLNFSYRWCMEDCVEFGWRADELKLMAKCAMLKSEWTVAHKYFELLKKTRNHAEWAKKYEQFIGHPEKMRTDPEFMQITYLKEYGNRLDGDNTLVELYMLQTFANGNGSDPVYQEQTLISAMQMKDIDLFWPRFARFCSMHAQEPNFRVPRYYQEAAWLYSQLEPQKPSVMYPGMTNGEAATRMPFDQSVKDKFNEFMQYNQQYNAQIGQQVAAEFQQRKAQVKTEEEQLALNQEMDDAFNEKMYTTFKPRFSDTFYFFYYLVRNQKTN